MADTCQNPLIQERLTVIFLLIQIRLTWGVRQIPRKLKATCPSFATFKDLFKKLLMSNRIFGCSSILSDKDLVKKLLTSNRIFGCSSITF